MRDELTEQMDEKEAKRASERSGEGERERVDEEEEEEKTRK